MKKIIKFIFTFFICSIIFVNNVSADTAYKYDASQVKTSVETLVSDLLKMNNTELLYYSENSIGWTQSASKELLTIVENGTLGGLKSIGKAELSEDGQMLIVKIRANYEKADLDVITRLTNISNSITVLEMKFSVIDTANQSMADRMLNALSNTLIGFSSVFIVLVLISFIISLFKYIPKLQEMFSKKNNTSVNDALEKAIAQIEQSETMEYADDTELVAVITAAICAATGASSDTFVVRSIKKANRKKKNV